jgi:hypothetical protein
MNIEVNAVSCSTTQISLWREGTNAERMRNPLAGAIEVNASPPPGAQTNLLWVSDPTANKFIEDLKSLSKNMQKKCSDLLYETYNYIA